MKRPTIAELEKKLNSADDQRDIEILPDGRVVTLSKADMVSKRLRIAKETLEVLQDRARKLESGLDGILAELRELLG